MELYGSALIINEPTIFSRLPRTREPGDLDADLWRMAECKMATRSRLHGFRGELLNFVE
jgi:hypothetical protein